MSAQGPRVLRTVRSLAEGHSIRRTVVGGLLLAVASFCWALVMPGIVAAAGGVFYRDGVLQKLPSEAKTKLQTFEREQRKRRATLTLIDDALAAQPTSPESLRSLIELRRHIADELRLASPPVSAIPFHLNPQLLLWPAIYTALGWLIVLFPPPIHTSISTRLRSRSLWTIGLLVYVMYEWPLWARNFVLSNEGRTVYAYPNVDVHVGSFVAQEAVIIGFCVLLAFLWLDWVEYYAVSVQRRLPGTNAVKSALAGELAHEVASMFLHWQVASVTLALGFLFFTNFFWTLVAGYRDQRYFLSAAIAHTLWAISWVLISLPVFERWRAWLVLERRATAELITSAASVDERRFKAEMLANLRPMSAAGLSVSGAAGLVSFLLPIVQLFL